MGIAIAKTIGGVIDASDASAHLVIAALFGALLWDLLTWIWALPVSSSHALVGGLLEPVWPLWVPQASSGIE